MKNAVNDRTSKQAELKTKPLNILENILLLLQPINCRLTALYFWYVAGLVQPYYGIAAFAGLLECVPQHITNQHAFAQRLLANH